MALVTLAIVGKDNTPLYLCDFDQDNECSNVAAVTKTMVKTVNKQNDDNTAKEDEDAALLYSFFEPSSKKQNESSSLKNQFIMYSALDRCEELIASKVYNINPNNDNSSSPQSSSTTTTTAEGIQNSMWIGLLGTIDEMKVYGYMTNTKIKFMASIQDTDDTTTFTRNKQHFAREGGLKSFFASMHMLYIAHVSNPFSQIIQGGEHAKKITSQKFDHSVNRLAKIFNDTYSSSLSTTTKTINQKKNGI